MSTEQEVSTLVLVWLIWSECSTCWWVWPRGRVQLCCPIWRENYAIIINFHQKSIKFLPSLGGFIAEEVVSTAVALDGGPSLNSGHVIVT